MGGTGNLPVPLGCQPSGMEGDVDLQASTVQATLARAEGLKVTISVD